MLDFENPHSFYFLEVIKRRKENPEMDRHQRLIKDFYIHSLEEFDVCFEKAKQLCDENNARAYFRLNVRDAKKIAFLYNKRLAEVLITEQYKSIPNLYSSVVGEFHQDKNKKWLIDFDREEGESSNRFTIRIDLVCKDIEEIFGGKVLNLLPTKNGYHAITSPFRMDLFKQIYPSIDVHRDNPTILYMP
jgi:hypothetical protein